MRTSRGIRSENSLSRTTGHFSAVPLKQWFTLSAILLVSTLSGISTAGGGTNDAAQQGCCSKHMSMKYFDTVDEALDEARCALADPDCGSYAAILYQVKTWDDRSAPVRVEFRVGGYGLGGYLYAKNNKVTLLFESAGSGQRLIDVRFLSHGYETIKQEVFINGGDILMWDDLVLQPISRRSAATVAGRVTLESNADPAGAVIVINGSDVAVADDDGYFVAYPVAPGDLRVSVTKAGYDSTPEKVHVKPGETATRNLRAYRYRYAHVRWVYQPDGSRDFTYGTEAGESWLSITGLNRISFAKGFSEVNGRSDFFVYQDGDKLRYKHFDQTGYDPQGSIYLDDVDFDAVDEAPKDGYDRRRKMCLHPGLVIVVACYDGKHFGKLQVLDITDQAPECN